MAMKIAEALLLRKQLEAKVKQLEPLKINGDRGLFELKTQRKHIGDSTDEVTFEIPKVTLDEVTADYDHYATQLRKIDTAIQKANWEHDVDYTEMTKPKTELKK